MRNKQFFMLGGIAVILAGLFTTMSLHEIFAQETNNRTSSTTSNQTIMMSIPQLNGSVNIRQQSEQFIQDNVKVPFASALQIAQTQVGNGTAISGRLGVVQGYLVYIFKLANFDAHTSRTVIVDAGNGSVLYTSGDMPLFFGGGLGCGFGGGHYGGHHMGFGGGPGGNYDRYGGTSGRSNSSGQLPSSGLRVVSPVIGV
ncbi:MAG: hypothetical protein M3261_03260 [Thermoproteota archaeon]|nr:hypothetical protein [Thermoproteota archaeon]